VYYAQRVNVKPKVIPKVLAAMQSTDNTPNAASQSQRLTTHLADPPTTDTLASNRVVVFADMLGFAALTEANVVDLRMLRAHSRLPDSFEALDERINHNNPLTKAFTRFHYSLDQPEFLYQLQ
jgi:hypothetical protein